VTPGGNNFNEFPDGQLTKFRVFIWLIPDFYHTPLKFLRSIAIRPPIGLTPLTSVAGTNLKVGALIRRKVPEKSFLVAPLHFFGSKSTISRFGGRFCDGQYSLVSFLFAVLLLTVPPCPAICKSGGTCPHAPWSRRHCR